MYRGKIKKVHFVGIGGSGMSGIAEVLINMGYAVSGSDMKENDAVKRLKGLGATVFIGHMKENVLGADCVVYSSAVKRDNPELQEARLLQTPIIPRAEMLAELMRMKYGVAVAGTHGKTTTTSMIAAVLAHAGLDPTVVTGGKLNSLGTNAKLGGGDVLVAEADESDGSFLKLSPIVAVVTNIDREHMDHYSDMDEVKEAYLNFVNKVPFYGCAIVCLDHPVIQDIIPGITRRYISYGLSAQADVHATAIEQSGGKSVFEAIASGRSIGKIEIHVPGVHNVTNALAVVAVGVELGIPNDKIIGGLSSFKGVERRFQIKGTEGGVTVIDDYGHHPVEIKAVLRAVKDGWRRRSVVVFQPHRYSRTKDLFKEFISAFNDADVVFLTDVYAAGEERIFGVGSDILYEAMKEHGSRNVFYVPDLKDVPVKVEAVLKPGDMVITLGAGDVWKAGERLVDLLKDKYR
ncbi:MAG: UDP-N-acetylmuramate--L-alanine ligase [Deltaproteobacteria bacterium]